MSASLIINTLDEVGFESVRLLTSLLWQSSVLLGGVAILSWMLRRRGASLRRALWVSGVLAVPVLPLLVYLGAMAGAPQAPLEIMPAYWPPRVSTVAAGEEGPESPLTLQTASTAEVSEPGYLSYPWALAFCVYLVGAGWFLLSIGRARVCIRRLIRNGIPTTDPRVLEAFSSAARGLGLRGKCRVLESDEAGAPVVVGVFRPVVLFGRDFGEKLSDADLAAVACHELAHVKRRDPLVLGLVSLVRAVFFFHPLIWFAARQIVVMAERAADDEVLARTARPVDYAGMLVRQARRFTAPLLSRRLAAGLVLSESVFLQRAKAILSKDRYGIKKLSLAGLVPTVIVMAAWLVFAASVPVEEGRVEGQTVQTYEVNIPDAWKSQIAVGKLTIEGPPFYMIPWSWGLEAVVCASLPVENLTSQALYVPMSFRTEPRALWPGGSNKEAGASYTLDPGEKRIVKAFVPLASVKRSIRFKLRMGAPFKGSPTPRSPRTSDILIVDPLPLSEPTVPDGNITLSNRLAEGLAAEEVALEHSETEGNVLRVSIRNDSEKSRQVVTRVAVNDLKRTGDGFSTRRFPSSFHEYVTTVPAGGTATVNAAYTVPDESRAPVLAFIVFEPRNQGFSTLGKYDHRKRDYTPVAWGYVSLDGAGEKRFVMPPKVPVEKRAKLTARTESQHFSFHYRAGSLAEKDIAKITDEREKAYQQLKDVLGMELPERVRIDLYPDMQAKGLGSGTGWTHANTVSAFHIAEVYASTISGDSHHELAHIFSFQFPGHADLGGQQDAAGRGLVEGFAQYFQSGGAGEARIKQMRKALKSTPNLVELLRGGEPTAAHIVFVHWLLTEDVEGFKRFYVAVTGNPTEPGIKSATEEAYGMTIDELQLKWREYLR